MEEKKCGNTGNFEKITGCVHLRYGVCRYRLGGCEGCALRKTKEEILRHGESRN